MHNYHLTDAQGNIIGTISLINDDLPTAIMNGKKVILGGSFTSTSKRFLNFFVTPEPYEPAESNNDRTDGTSGRRS